MVALVLASICIPFVGGLLALPAVVDVIATLRVLADPTANAALVRLLTGPRWRIGPRDLALLGRRAAQLAAATPAEPPADPLVEPLPPTWNPTEEQRTEAFAHTSNACLTIERIDRATSLSWDAVDRAWTADGKSVCVGDVTEGPGGYGAEVTVSGGMTFGYVWHAMGAEAGLYRLTFSLKPGAGVDISPSTQLYPSATTEEGGHGHKPPGAGEDEATAVAAAEATAEAEAGGSMGGSTGGSTTGGKPTPNVPVIMPELDLSYIDVGLDYTPTVPTMPLSLTAARAVEQITLTWQPPAFDGMGAVTEYVVNGVRDDDGAVLPEQRIAAGSPLTATYADLVGGEPYTFTVAAVNSQGVGAAASITSVPRIRPATAPPPASTPPAVAPPASTPPAVAPPASTPPAVAPPAAPKSATVRVKAVAGKSRLYVNVNPNKGKGYWQVTIQKKSGKVWKALPTVYRTKGSAETLTLDLPKGSYRAVVLPKYGRTGATSGSVTLAR